MDGNKPDADILCQKLKDLPTVNMVLGKYVTIPPTILEFKIAKKAMRKPGAKNRVRSCKPGAKIVTYFQIILQFLSFLK